jgi:DtxR family Mn-dependent transcriptional regulator
MKSTARENYLKTIFELQSAQEADAPVAVGVLAKALGVTPGTVTGMAKKLAREKLIRHQAYEGLRLTTKGQDVAISILRRHRILELFLVEVVGLDWSEVHEEAERLEHAVSDRVLAGLDRMLGFPKLDPHGDPIPTADGKIAAPPQTSLADSQAGDRCVVARVLDESRPFLQFIGSIGLKPGTPIRIEQIHPEAGTIQVLPETGSTVTLGLVPANKLLVQYP